jgi:hypothetical protein
MKNETLKKKCKEKDFRVEDLPDGRLLIDESIYIRNLHTFLTIKPDKNSHFTIIGDTALVQLDDLLQLLKDARNSFTP